MQFAGRGIFAASSRVAEFLQACAAKAQGFLEEECNRCRHGEAVRWSPGWESGDPLALCETYCSDANLIAGHGHEGALLLGLGIQHQGIAGPFTSPSSNGTCTWCTIRWCLTVSERDISHSPSAG